MKILFDKGKGFLYIEITKAVSFADLCGGGGADKAVDKQIEVPDQMKGGLLSVIYNIQHFIFHGFCNIFIVRLVDWLIQTFMLYSGYLTNIPMALAQLNFQSQFGTNYNLAFASYLLLLIPILIFYVICQKQILNGVVNGAVK